MHTDETGRCNAIVVCSMFLTYLVVFGRPIMLMLIDGFGFTTCDNRFICEWICGILCLIGTPVPRTEETFNILGCTHRTMNVIETTLIPKLLLPQETFWNYVLYIHALM